MAEEIERYQAKVNFKHKFENVTQQFDRNLEIPSPKFFARNIPFRLDLLRKDNGDISCDLTCVGVKSADYSANVEYRLSLITPSKTVQSEEFSCTISDKDYYDDILLSEIFPGEEIFLDDAVTIEVSLWVDEPEGRIEYKPPKKQVLEDLQVVENQIQGDAFASLLESGDFSDVTFLTNVYSFEVKAHKAILASRSQVFARMLTTDMKEANDNQIQIDDMGGDSLKILLHHIYTGNLEFPKGVKIDLKICQELVNAAEKYDLQNFKEYAAMAMTEFVSLDNAWELFIFAKRLKAEAATKTLTTYYAGNVLRILEKA